MTTQYGNRIVASITSTGTGTANLGSAVGTFLPFTALTSGMTVGYAIDDAVNAAWEVGTGVYTSGSPGTLTRVVETSTNSNSAINLSGSAQVAISLTAAQITALAPLASPTFTGTPAAPTAAVATSTTQLATTAFVIAAIQASNDIGRNKIHNPLFNIQQRGTGAFTANLAYTADRWILQLTGDSNSVTIATLADADRTAIGDEEAQYALVNACTGASSAADFSNINQRIENTYRLSNKTVTVSFWAKAATGTPKVGVSIDQSFGSGGSSAVQGNGTAFTLSTTWTRYSGQFSIASDSGKTVGAGNYTAVNFWYSSASTNATRAGSIGVQTATISLWGVQLEINSIETQLEKPDPRYDLANCQRFYNAGAIIAASYGVTSGTIYVPLGYPVTMRASPTVAGANNSSTNITSPSAVLSSGAPTQVVVAQGTCTSTGAYILNVTYTSTADL